MLESSSMAAMQREIKELRESLALSEQAASSAAGVVADLTEVSFLIQRLIRTT
jgi:hypothetical protein